MRLSFLVPVVAAASLAGMTAAHADSLGALAVGFGSPYPGITGGHCCGWREPTFGNKEAYLHYIEAISALPVAPTVPVHAYGAVLPQPHKKHAR